MYTDLILDLNRNPLNKREMPDADITHSGANPLCGDHVRMYVKLNHAGNGLRGAKTVREISFEGMGCAISMASASLLAEELKEKSLDEILALKTKDIFEMLGTELTPSRVKCGLLPLETLQEGIKRHKE